MTKPTDIMRDLGIPTIDSINKDVAILLEGYMKSNDVMYLVGVLLKLTKVSDMHHADLKQFEGNGNDIVKKINEIVETFKHINNAVQAHSEVLCSHQGDLLETKKELHELADTVRKQGLLLMAYRNSVQQH